MMKLLKTLVDRELLILLLPGLGFGVLAIQSPRMFPASFSSDTVGTPLGTVFCQPSPCIKLKSSLGPPLSLNALGGVPFFKGEEFIVSSPSQSLTLRFSAGGETTLKTIGSVLAEDGFRNFSADEIDTEGKIEDAGKPDSLAAEGTVFFLGDSEIQILSPLPGSVIMTESLPHTFPMSLKIKLSSRDDINLHRARKWKLIRYRSNSQQTDAGVVPSGTVELSVFNRVLLSPKMQKANLSGSIHLKSAGRYGLIPSDRPLTSEEVRMRFEVHSSSNRLRQELRKQLKNSSLSSGSPNIFIER